MDDETGAIMWDALDSYKKAATEADARAAAKAAKNMVADNNQADALSA